MKKYFCLFLLDMSYGPGIAYEPATSNGSSRENEYHQYSNHYHSSTRSQHQSRPYSNGFHDSLTLNGQNNRTHIDDEHHQEQIDDDYEEIAPDRPKFLMWGLTK